MIERYTLPEKAGQFGVYLKVKELIYDMGYKVLKIEHTMVPLVYPGSTPYSSAQEKNVPGFRIVVDTKGYAPGEKPVVPKIIERLK